MFFGLVCLYLEKTVERLRQDSIGWTEVFRIGTGLGAGIQTRVDRGIMVPYVIFKVILLL